MLSGYAGRQGYVASAAGLSGSPFTSVNAVKVIFDEGVPEVLEAYLPSYEISTVKRQGWRGTKNGKLLDLIEGAAFKVFITCDKRMEREQNLSCRPFAIFLLSTNHWPTMESHVGRIASALDKAQPGTVMEIDCGIFVPKRFRKLEGP